MNNEEKILALLEQMSQRFDDVDSRLDAMQGDISGLKQGQQVMQADIDQIKEDTTITRATVNNIGEWTDLASGVLKIDYPLKKAE